MVEAFSRMKKFAEQREEGDIKIISWWVMVLVVMMAAVLAFFSYQLGLFTLIAFTSYIVYKRVERRDKHFSRIDSFIESAIDCTQEYAQDFEGDVSEELDDMRGCVFGTRHPPKRDVSPLSPCLVVTPIIERLHLRVQETSKTPGGKDQSRLP